MASKKAKKNVSIETPEDFVVEAKQIVKDYNESCRSLLERVEKLQHAASVSAIEYRDASAVHALHAVIRRAGEPIHWG